MSAQTPAFPCETCAIRRSAETNPKSFKAKLWRWHTIWCPGWKAYQKVLGEHNTPSPAR